MRTNLSEDGGGVCVMHFILPSTVCFCVGVGRKGGRERFTRQCPQQASKFKLYKFLVTSILLYGCETWTLSVKSEEKKKDPGFRYQVPKKTSPHLLLGPQDQRLGAEQDQLPYGSTGTSSGNCQETETCIVSAYHTTTSPKPSFRAPWRVVDAVVGKGNAGSTHQGVDIPARARTAHKGPLQKTSEEGLC